MAQTKYIKRLTKSLRVLIWKNKKKKLLKINWRILCSCACWYLFMCLWQRVSRGHIPLYHQLVPTSRCFEQRGTWGPSKPARSPGRWGGSDWQGGWSRSGQCLSAQRCRSTWCLSRTSSPQWCHLPDLKDQKHKSSAGCLFLHSFESDTTSNAVAKKAAINFPPDNVQMTSMMLPYLYLVP